MVWYGMVWYDVVLLKAVSIDLALGPF